MYEFFDAAHKTAADRRVREVLEPYDLRRVDVCKENVFTFKIEPGSNEGSYITIGSYCYRIGVAGDMALVAYYEAIGTFMNNYKP